MVVDTVPRPLQLSLATACGGCRTPPARCSSPCHPALPRLTLRPSTVTKPTKNNKMVDVDPYGPDSVVICDGLPPERGTDARVSVRSAGMPGCACPRLTARLGVL